MAQSIGPWILHKRALCLVDSEPNNPTTPSLPNTPFIHSYISSLLFTNYCHTLISSLQLTMAASLTTFSRLISSTTVSLLPSKTLPSKLSIRLPASRHARPLRFSSSSSSSTITAAIGVGDKLPEATFSFLDSDGEVKTTTVSELTKGKKAVLFAVPGAFTPTCSQKHVPGFVEKSGELKAKGVDTIACISVNDAFVMKAWKEDLKVNDEVLLLSDGNGTFTKAIGCELDLSDKPVGLGVRSRRYALLAEDGVVKLFNLEEGGAFTFSGAQDILDVL
ncbi:hypothetical protein VNO80_04186 [Phaseolus coccineus]|uniref:Glutaredoxin-dependent peroxiredoxin n=1 Tax=Phaseolus coccineus TaxID=3886 RepID=A0AAN9RNK5_PHACN